MNWPSHPKLNILSFEQNNTFYGSFLSLSGASWGTSWYMSLFDPHNSVIVWGCLSPKVICKIWWCHQIDIFSALLVFCEENPPVTSGYPSQRQVTRSFDVFFDLRLDKRLSKQSKRRWFETPPRSLWCHCNEHNHARKPRSIKYNRHLRIEL